MPSRVFAILLLLLLAKMPLHAQKWIGAEKMLERISDRLTGRIRDWEVKTPIDLQAFSTRLPKLTPKEAVSQWLALLDRYLAKKPNVRGDYPDTIRMYLEAIPPPNTWKVLALALRAHKPLSPSRVQEERVLKILASVLEGDNQRVRAEVKAFQQEFPDSRVEQTLTKFLADLEKSVPSLLKTQQSSQQDILKKIEEQIRLNPYYDLSFDSPYQYPYLTEEAFYTEIFTTLKTEFRLDATRFYFPHAYKAALNNIDRLPVAQWAMACTPQNIALYEALERKFPLDQERSSSRRLALGYYILSLGMVGRTQEAVALLQQEGKGKTGTLFGEDFGSISHRSVSLRTPTHSRVWVRLLCAVLQKDPSLNYWNSLFNFARISHSVGALESLLWANLANQNLSPELRSKIEENLYTAYCANDHTEEAVALLKEVWTRTHKSPKVSNLPPNALVTYCIEYMSELGYLCRHPEWIEQALQYAQTANTTRFPLRGWISPIKHLADMGKALEAERLLLKRADTLMEEDREQAEGLLEALIHIYSRTKKYKDLFFLLDRSRYWGATDVRDFYGNNHIKLAIAEALVHTGRANLATHILVETLRNKMVDVNHETPISAYITPLIQLNKEKTRPLFEGLLLLYPDMPPLLYGKALLLRQEGKREEAEKVALLALRYYQGRAEVDAQEGIALCTLLEELATTREDRKRAQVHKNRASALRLMTQAQECAFAGLVKREHDCYRKAFALAPDIASVRLAIARLAEEEENLSEARQHYTALLEGELAFTNVRRVFRQPWHISHIPYMSLGHFQKDDIPINATLYTQISQQFVYDHLKRKPNDPTVLTFGALYLSDVEADVASLYQSNQETVVSLLQRAVQKDPTSVLAWQTLYPHSRRIPSLVFPEETLLWLLKSSVLDPLDSLPKTIDLKRLWNTLESLQPFRLPDVQESLYVLSAARRRWEEKREEEGAGSGIYVRSFGPPEKPVFGNFPLPREVFIRQDKIQNIIVLLRNLRPK